MKNKKHLTIVFILLILIAIILGAAILIKNNDNKRTEERVASLDEKSTKGKLSDDEILKDATKNEVANEYVVESYDGLNPRDYIYFGNNVADMIQNDACVNEIFTKQKDKPINSCYSEGYTYAVISQKVSDRDCSIHVGAMEENENEIVIPWYVEFIDSEPKGFNCNMIFRLQTNKALTFKRIK